jgi:small subunit ribosomal protein S17
MSDAENTEEASTETASEGTTVESPVATASAPDRSDDDTETGVGSASEQPDASASEPTSTAASQRTRHVRKAREGVVVSSKPDKTVVVAVIERVRHPKYNKFVLQTKKLYAHDEANDVNVGDRVRVMETRPLSKLKRWRVTDVLERAK